MSAIILITSIIVFSCVCLTLWVLHARQKQTQRLEKRNSAIQERQAQAERDRLLRLSGQSLHKVKKEVPPIYQQMVSKNADQQVRRDEDERRKRREEDSSPVIFPAPFLYDSGPSSNSSNSNHSSSHDSGYSGGGDSGSSSSSDGGSW